MTALAAVCCSPGSGVEPAAREQVAAMLAAAPHRGTTATIAARGHCVAGVSRHSNDGNDAVAGCHERLVVAFEGRLDNRSDIARDCGASPDTPLVPLLSQAFLRWGDALPRHLRGRYAVVVSDGETIWAWRDHLGFGPCFWRQEGGRIWLASEAKQVAVGAGIPAVADVEVVERILWGDYDDDTPAALRGVSRLRKAALLVGTGDRTRVERYWRPEQLLERRPTPSMATLQHEFDALMQQACTRVLTGADVVSLSGGLDSPAVAAYAAPAYLARTGRPLPALTTTYPQYPTVDETPWVSLVAQELSLALEAVPHQALGLGALDRWTQQFDGPVPALWIEDLRVQYDAAAARGYRTILTGEIAEFVADMRGALVPHLLRTKRWRAAAANLAMQRRRGVHLSRLARQVMSAAVPAAVMSMACRRGWAAGDSPVRWVDAQRLRDLRARTVESPGRSWTAWQLGAFEGPGLSIEADDVLQASSGVTTRRPWADVDLWEWFLGLPAETKFPDGRRKGVARLLLHGRVPDAIVHRSSKTFFDEALLGDADYAELSKWLIRPPHRFAGIDYVALAEDLDRRSLDLPSYVWAKNLAAAHAFVTVMQ